MTKPNRYKKAVIYFLSGTGNSYRISKNMGNIAKDNHIDAIVSSVNDAKPLEEISKNNHSILGLIFPTHGFTAPWHMIKFAFRLPRQRKTHAFCAATRAGLRFGKVFTPGISGSATFVIALILVLKGYRVRGVESIDMPSNWYSLHPIQKEQSVAQIIDRAYKKATTFMGKNLEGKKNWLTWNNLYEIIWGVLLVPVSLGYLLFGRFFLAKLFFANKNCDGCSLCSKNCPVNAINMKGDKTPRPFWKYNCESCMRCAAFCPKKAIEAGHSWGIILWMITTIPVSLVLNTYLTAYIPNLANLYGTWSKKVLNIIYFYLSLSVSYKFFHLMINFPIINRLFSLTTFTHVKSWGRYREPNVKLKHLFRKKS
jgi:ferredoxin